ncbi:conserved hypothetical protein, partial [Ricinus communis]
MIGKGRRDRPHAEGQHRPHELDAALGRAGVSRAAQHVHHIDHHLGDVARHQRGRRKMRQQEPADGAMHAHRRRAQEACGHHPARSGRLHRRSGHAAHHEAQQQHQLQQQRPAQRAALAALDGGDEQARCRHAQDESGKGQELEQDGHLRT